MNPKFVTLAIFAIIGYALAAAPDSLEDEGHSEAIRLMPTDGAETGYLQGHYVMFSDYCIRARDTIKNFLQESVNGATADVYDALFSEISYIGDQLLESQKSAVEEGARIIKERAIAPAKDELAQSKEEIIDDLEKTTEKLSLLQYVSNAIKVVLYDVIQTVKNQAFQRIAYLRSKMDGETLKSIVENSCQKIQYELQNRLNSQLTSAKDEIRKSSSRSQDSVAILDMIKKVKPETTGCVSTHRIGKLVKFCEVFRVAGPTLFPLLGM